MAYLDDTGLAYFWGKIKAWANSVFALLGHTHPSSDVALMTGYSKPSSGSAIAATDTLNQAVGKIEAKVDAIDGDYVHRTGADETITSVKTFSGTFSVTSVPLILRHPNLVRGTTPSSDQYFNIPFLDSSGAFWDVGGSHGRMGILECGVMSGGSLYVNITAFRPVAGSTETAQLSVGFSAGGNAWSRAVPTPVSSPDNRDIITRGYLDGADSGVVHNTGAETVDGIKSFVGGTRGINKDNVSESANNLYVNTAGVASSYYTTTNSSTLLTDIPASSVNTTINSYTVRYLSSSDRVINQICHNRSGLYFRRFNSESSSSWTAWKSFAFTEDVVTKAGAQTITGTKTFDGCDVVVKRGAPIFMAYNVNIPNSGITTGSYTNGGCSMYNWDGSVIIGSMRVGNAPTYNQARLSVYKPGGTDVMRSVSIELYKDNNTCTFFPSNNNAIALGSSSYKWSVVYASTGTINTSDIRLKNSVASVPDEVLDAWEGVDFCQFRFNDSVAEKGDGARIHAGVIAQDVQKAFGAAGIDAGRYGFFCWDSWEGRETYDDDGNPVPESYVPAGDQYSIRYEELLCIEAAYMRRENARLKKRVADLEDRLAALELRLGSE